MSEIAPDAAVARPGVGARGRAYLGRVWQRARVHWPRIVVVVSALLVLLFIVFVVRPFASARNPTADDVADAWNASIARLGILPIFPPVEDVDVGDVWAVVAEAGQTPLLGKGTRIGHIDLRDEVVAGGRGRPVFEDTAKLQTGDEYRKQSRHAATQKDDEPLSSTLVAFPGVSISRVSRADGSVGWFAGAFGAANEEQLEERIAIRSAETYGIPTATAVLRLSKWCSDEETSVYCSDQFARRILAFAVSDQVLATRDGKYLARLQLQLITRVFLAREIEQSRRAGDQRGAAIQLSAEPSREAAKPAPDGSDQPDTARDVLPVAAPGANSKISRSAGNEVTLKQVFQRPLVFGYRAITITLAPSAPGTEELP